MCATLEQALRLRHFEPKTNHKDIIAIRQVMLSLEREPSIDEVWRKRVRSIKKEFDGVLRERDRKKADKELKQRGFKAEWENASAEKERMPKGTGHRDSWNPYE
jgi:hypothetical protein